jgi:hypothetical protein
MFGKLKDLRRIHTRYDRCAHLLLSHLYRRFRHLLDQSMSPDPSSSMKSLFQFFSDGIDRHDRHVAL